VSDLKNGGDARLASRTRRAALALVLALACTALAATLPRAALAQADSPLAKVKATLTKSNQIVTGAGDHNAKLAELKGLLRGFLDTDALGKKSMGKHLDGKTPEQVRTFLDLFRELFIRTYVQRLLLFDAPDFEYGEEKITGSAATVDTWIVTPRDKFSADYRLEKKPDGWVATDILIEDVSLADNFKSQFDKALAKGSWDELITRLKNKLETKSDSTL
jgi:phospholipid transport system substrate-binding protein